MYKNSWQTSLLNQFDDIWVRIYAEVIRPHKLSHFAVLKVLADFIFKFVCCPALMEACLQKRDNECDQVQVDDTVK